MAQLNNLPSELWELIFGDEILEEYSDLLCFVNKRVYKICSKKRNYDIMSAAAMDGHLDILLTH